MIGPWIRFRQWGNVATFLFTRNQEERSRVSLPVTCGLAGFHAHCTAPIDQWTIIAKSRRSLESLHGIRDRARDACSSTARSLPGPLASEGTPGWNPATGRAYPPPVPSPGTAVDRPGPGSGWEGGSTRPPLPVPSLAAKVRRGEPLSDSSERGVAVASRSFTR